MKNNIAILVLLTVVMTACGTFKKAANLPDTTTTTQTTPQVITTTCDAIIATLGDWQTLTECRQQLLVGYPGAYGS